MDVSHLCHPNAIPPQGHRQERHAAGFSQGYLALECMKVAWHVRHAEMECTCSETLALPKSLLLSAMKNEGPFLIEWVAYHRVIGFEQIVIHSNDCDDKSDLLLDALHDAGIVRHIRHSPPDGIAPQRNVAQLSNKTRLLNDGTWSIFLDADEFLNIHIGDRTLPSLIHAMGTADAILAPWRFYGDGGNVKFTGRHISDAFTGSSAEKSAERVEVKTFFKMSKKFLGFGELGHHRPIIHPETQPVELDVRTGSGNTIDKNDPTHSKWFAGIDFALNARIADNEIGREWLQVNHYAVRTREMLALKRQRGRGWKANQNGVLNERHTAAYFQTFNHNEAIDDSILFWQDSVTREIQNLRELPGVQLAEANSLHQTQENLRKIENSADEESHAILNATGDR